MGSWTNAIMWGVERPEGLCLFDEETDDGGIADRWMVACGEKINASAEALKQESGYGTHWDVEHLFVPREDDARRVIGMWVAVGASGRGGVPDLEEPVAFDALESTEPYAASLRRARERWAEFAAWAATQGIALPEPKLWLVSTGVS